MSSDSVTLGQGPRADAVTLRSDRFRLEREADWQRLETILNQIEKRRAHKLDDDDVLAVPVLYRTLLSGLSIARESSLDAGLIDYLEGLSLRAYFTVYGTRSSFGTWLGEFFGGGLSAAIRSIVPEILVTLAFMVLGTIIGYALVAGNVDWFYALVPGQPGDVRVPGASRDALRATLFSSGTDFLSVFAAFLFSNNAQVSILCFALGFAFGVPALMLVVHNTASLGAMLWLFQSQGLLVEFVGWLAIHGTTELFAILLAGAAGLHVGRTLAFPGERSYLTALKDAGQRGAQVMAGVVVMLICAGLLEGFGRQLINDTGARYAIGGIMLAFWIGYFFLFGRRAR